MSEQRKHIEVVAAIIKKDNTILATQRGYGDLKDGWEFPGGKIEPGEPHEVALIREIKEEQTHDVCELKQTKRKRIRNISEFL